VQQWRRSTFRSGTGTGRTEELVLMRRKPAVLPPCSVLELKVARNWTGESAGTNVPVEVPPVNGSALIGGKYVGQKSGAGRRNA